MSKIIEHLKWRYAVKKYDSNRKIKKEDLDILKQAIRLSPSSIGLQAYTILEIENEELRERLKSVSDHQSQITDASHLFVFCAKTKIENEYADLLVETMANARAIEIENLSGYKNAILHRAKTLSKEELIDWNANQIYLSLGFLLQTAAALEIDATPIEGFSKNEYDTILGLANKDLTAVVVCTLGYRSVEDKYQYLAKSRKELKYLFETVK